MAKARKSRARMLTVNLPMFPGFYESDLSHELDRAEENEAEWMAERQEEDGIPKELRLTASEIGEQFFYCADYSAAHAYLAKEWVASLECALDANGLKLPLHFESMDSPREYNFATDRVYAEVRFSDMRRLFTESKREKHATLAAVIKERFTSYDGFISGYSNKLADWLESPIDEWDHNELGTLLIATLRRLGIDESELGWSIYYSMAESSDFYEALSEAIDWPKLEIKLAELRDDKAEELREDDPDYVPPEPRCPMTLDMFTGKEG